MLIWLNTREIRGNKVYYWCWWWVWTKRVFPGYMLGRLVAWLEFKSRPYFPSPASSRFLGPSLYLIFWISRYLAVICPNPELFRPGILPGRWIIIWWCFYQAQGSQYWPSYDTFVVYSPSTIYMPMGVMVYGHMAVTWPLFGVFGRCFELNGCSYGSN